MSINLKHGYRLTEKLVDFKHWDDFKEGHYSLYEYNGSLCGIHFRCPGCGAIIAIDIGYEPSQPKWNINFETLTATPSILHLRDGNGCGWHGYMTNAELKPC